MQATPHTRTRVRSQRSRRRHVVAAALIGVVFAAGGLAQTASADALPERIDGDPHSPQVAHLATVTLEAKAAYELNPTPETESAYASALAETATVTAGELGVSGTSLEQAWRGADGAHQTAVLTALTQLGVQYRSNTSDPLVGFDCSGLTSFAWREAGVQLSRQSGAQISEAEERTEETAMAGDLVQYPGHVMLYLGVPDAVVHASNPETDVELWLLGDRSVRFADPSGLTP